MMSTTLILETVAYARLTEQYPMSAGYSMIQKQVWMRDDDTFTTILRTAYGVGYTPDREGDDTPLYRDFLTHALKDKEKHAVVYRGVIEEVLSEHKDKDDPFSEDSTITVTQHRLPTTHPTLYAAEEECLSHL